jgi:hypothetical protein
MAMTTKGLRVADPEFSRPSRRKGKAMSVIELIASETWFPRQCSRQWAL